MHEKMIAATIRSIVSPRRKKTEGLKGRHVTVFAFGIIFVLGSLLGDYGLTPGLIILTLVCIVVFCVVLAGTIAQHREQKMTEERQRQEREERLRQMEEERRRKREQQEEERRREEEDRRKRQEQREEERRREEEQRAAQIEALLQRDSFRETVDYLSGVEFENFMANVFHQKGYSVALTPGSGDQGVDLLLDIDERRVAVQLKRYTAPVGNAAVQQALAGMIHYKAKEAWVIATTTFTKSATQLAKSTGVRLIDRNELEDWLSDLREEGDNPSPSPDRRRQRRRRY
jgi:restriction endonuclease Mrr